MLVLLGGLKGGNFFWWGGTWIFFFVVGFCIFEERFCHMGLQGNQYCLGKGFCMVVREFCNSGIGLTGVFSTCIDPGLQSFQWLVISNELRGSVQIDWSYWGPTSCKFQGSGGEIPRLQVLLGSNFLQAWHMGSKVSRDWPFSKVRGKSSKVEESIGGKFSIDHNLPVFCPVC
ncbi:hypothetical protein PGTUg99_034630 [Puccinia graminis f. sp. tritici]|uniref:Uncharacterized protein n=1 Tax=Puccinia graminis f. sp. tritici TaxID=56615 RepID=A0A5B0S0J7_PUCGR|nr:hypothetical protein PGTUg99_034630 [Puccinia graminis f. sp. tritici]